MELYINDTLVDIDERVPFPLTYEIADIRDLDKRKANSSKTIKLPGTQLNESILTSVFILTSVDGVGLGQGVGNYQFDVSVKARARYYEDGILVFQGLVKLEDCTLIDSVWNFSVTLYSDTVDIFSLLKNYKVRELGWSEYDHDWNYGNITAAWNGTIQKNGGNYSNISGSNWIGEGYYYGLIDYGFPRPALDTWQVNHIPPQIFVKSIVDKMLDLIGVSYESDFFNTAIFKRLLLAWEGGNLPTIDATISAANSVESDQDNILAGGFILNNSRVAFKPWLENYWSILFNDYVGVAVDAGTIVDPSGLVQTNNPYRFIAESEGDYQIAYNGDHDVNFNINVVNTGGSTQLGGILSMFLQVYINGSWNRNIEVWRKQYSQFAGTSDSFTASFSHVTDLYLYPTDEVTFTLNLKSTNLHFYDDPATSVDFAVDITATNVQIDTTYKEVSVQPGAPITLTQFLPEMDCATFLKGIVNAFNLYLKPMDNEPKNLKIEPLNTFYKPYVDAVDWTDKIDYSKEFKITPTVNIATKEYNYKFVEDLDYWNKRYKDDVQTLYGNKQLINSSQLAQGNTEIKLPFANKLLRNVTDTDIIIPACYQVKNLATGGNDLEQRKGKPFLVQIKAGTVPSLQTEPWVLVDETDVANAQASYPYVGHLDNIDNPQFDLTFNIPSYVFFELSAGVNYTTNNLYIYHEKFVKELVNGYGRLVSAYINLDPIDINTLDFAKLVKIDGVLYRLQKVDNYDSGKNVSTRVELLKLIEGKIIQAYTEMDTIIDPYAGLIKAGRRRTEDGIDRVTEESTPTTVVFRKIEIL